ncbi:MAG: hypothetical protein ACOX01_08125 [Methanobrevibacter boviskoreani]|jgi:hypothetical protein|uniref:hypothetical protein n=1 Tax=Methanobrevibacter boviskoreani TaxID=1348249 RepID=UPI0023A8B3BD|nr:hypothetical protein [Methanobrevibacter boviskoreani]MDD6256077.1 hypothetical protein [Methanobrevibacter boviskoreani]MDY5614110.1 hypothetical protein [Methanobrevibacter boviskoreani]
MAPKISIKNIPQQHVKPLLSSTIEVIIHEISKINIKPVTNTFAPIVSQYYFVYTYIFI